MAAPPSLEVKRDASRLTCPSGQEHGLGQLCFRSLTWNQPSRRLASVGGMNGHTRLDHSPRTAMAHLSLSATFKR